MPHQLDRLLDAVEVALEPGMVAFVLELLRPRIEPAGELDVLGNVDHHRTWAPALGDVERLVQDTRQVGDVLDEVIVLGAGPRDADRVAFLERVVADQMGRNLPGDDHDRDRVAERVGKAGDRVGRAGSRRHQHAADLAGRARIALGGVHGALLVPHQDVLDLLLLEERIVDRQYRTARIAEQVFDPLVGERLDHHLRAGHLLAHDQLHLFQLSEDFKSRESKRAARALDTHRHNPGWPSHPRRCVSLRLRAARK